MAMANYAVKNFDYADHTTFLPPEHITIIGTYIFDYSLIPDEIIILLPHGHINSNTREAIFAARHTMSALKVAAQGSALTLRQLIHGSGIMSRRMCAQPNCTNPAKLGCFVCGRHRNQAGHHLITLFPSV